MASYGILHHLDHSQTVNFELTTLLSTDESDVLSDDMSYNGTTKYIELITFNCDSGTFYFSRSRYSKRRRDLMMFRVYNLENYIGDFQHRFQFNPMNWINHTESLDSITVINNNQPVSRCYFIGTSSRLFQGNITSVVDDVYTVTFEDGEKTEFCYEFVVTMLNMSE